MFIELSMNYLKMSKSCQKRLINKISKILLVLQLKSVKVLKLKDIKYITKKILLGYKEYSCGEIYSPW